MNRQSLTFEFQKSSKGTIARHHNVRNFETITIAMQDVSRIYKISSIIYQVNSIVITIFYVFSFHISSKILHNSYIFKKKMTRPVTILKADWPGAADVFQIENKTATTMSAVVTSGRLCKSLNCFWPLLCYKTKMRKMS